MPDQCHFEPGSASSLGKGVRASDVEEGSDVSSFKEATTKKLYKHEELLSTVMEKLDAVLERINNFESQSN